MAKKSILELTPEFFELDVGDIEPIMLSATRAQIDFVDFSTEMEYTITGKGLKVVNGLVVGGTIETFEITDFKGEVVMTASHLGINAGILAGDSIEDMAISLTTVMLLGNNDLRGTNGNDVLDGNFGDDIVRGRAGDDILYGSFGKDALIGGEGSDNFVYVPGMGRDVIRDFDLDGTDGDLDSVFISGADLSKSKKDTIIDYGDGDIFVLKNVKLSDFEDAFVL